MSDTILLLNEVLGPQHYLLYYTNARKTFLQDEEILRFGNVTAPWEIVSAPINYPQQGADNNECGMFVCKYCNLC